MLTHPDRQKFEQIRARWEAAQPGEEESATMVGRKVSQQPANSDAQPNAGSKFRRKLSHGLAFISHPLSQRKLTPGRQATSNAILAVTAPATNTFIRQCEVPLSPTPKPASLKRSNGSPDEAQTPADHESSPRSIDTDATPKALPRSRTTSFLPRPVRADPDASTTEPGRAIKLPPRVVLADPKLRVLPSKIPTSSPPLSERRVSSPRQYIPQYTSAQAKYIAAGHAFAGYSAGSPSKAALRSRTTPNLVKTASSPRPASFMAQTQAGLQRLAVSPTVPKPALQENIPTNKRVSQRRSYIQEKQLRRESLAMPTTIPNRRSFGPVVAFAQGKQSNQGTPINAKKRLSSNFAQQTPLTAKRVQQSEQASLAQQSPLVANSGSIAQPRLMGPRNPPTPTPLTAETPRPALPQSNTDKDLQRKTLGTPNGLGGVWRSSRALATANHEVRRLPRSSTFHDFGIRPDPAPPVPPIPEQYQTPSLSNLFQSSFVEAERSLELRQSRIISVTASFESIPEETAEQLHSAHSAHSEHSTASLQTESRRSSSPEPSNLSTDRAALLPVPRPERPPHSTPSLPLPPIESQHIQARSQIERPWSISDRQYEDSADVEPHLQVRDYMPPLYWAGRFQSRFDQWRTEAMMIELNSKYQPEAEGQLAQCKLSQEKLAACYIFAQLRDLCLTEQAADSLWEFEFKYRKDNKLLGNPEFPMQPPRKHDDQGTHKGAFGRAVRKLTPRKSSFVNLLKGKGWGKSDDMRGHDMSEQSLETSSGSS